MPCLHHHHHHHHCTCPLPKAIRVHVLADLEMKTRTCEGDEGGSDGLVGTPQGSSCRWEWAKFPYYYVPREIKVEREVLLEDEGEFLRSHMLRMTIDCATDSEPAVCPEGGSLWDLFGFIASFALDAVVSTATAGASKAVTNSIEGVVGGDLQERLAQQAIQMGADVVTDVLGGVVGQLNSGGCCSVFARWCGCLGCEVLGTAWTTALVLGAFVGPEVQQHEHRCSHHISQGIWFTVVVLLDSKMVCWAQPEQHAK
eukprot:350499-Chlamydomonas_euryale.AAC.1